MVSKCVVVPVSVGLVGSVVTSGDITVATFESAGALVSVGLMRSVVTSGETATVAFESVVVPASAGALVSVLPVGSVVTSGETTAATFESVVAFESRGEPGLGETAAESTASAGVAVVIEASEVDVCGTHAEVAVAEAVQGPTFAQVLHQAVATTHLAQPIRAAQLLDDRGECVGRDSQLFGGECRLDARARIGQSFVDASEGSVALRRDRRAALSERDPPAHHEVTDTEASEACAPAASVIVVAAGVVAATVATVRVASVIVVSVIVVSVIVVSVIVVSVIVVSVTVVSVTVVSVAVAFAGVVPAGVSPAGILARRVRERRTIRCAVACAGAIEP